MQNDITNNSNNNDQSLVDVPLNGPGVILSLDSCMAVDVTPTVSNGRVNSAVSHTLNPASTCVDVPMPTGNHEPKLDDNDITNSTANMDEENPISSKPQDENAKYPECFYCPITNKIMTDPVVSPLGTSFERDDLSDARAFYPNRALKAYIEQEMQQREEAGSIRGTIRSWNESLRCGIHKVVAPRTFRPLPDVFYCPITCDLMYDPVIDPEGNTYERGAIIKWIEKHGSSPVTRSRLAVNQLYNNTALFDALLEKTMVEEDESNNMHPSIRRWQKEVAVRQREALKSVGNVAPTLSRWSTGLAPSARAIRRDTDARPDPSRRRREPSDRLATPPPQTQQQPENICKSFLCFLAVLVIIMVFISTSVKLVEDARERVD